MQHFGGGPPRLIIKQRCGAVAAALLESPPPAPSQRSWQPEPPRACSMPGMQPAAQPGDPVMTSGRRQAQHAEHTALENDTEQYWQSAGVGPHSDPSDCRPPQPWQPNLPGSSTGNPESAAKTAQQQPPQPPPSASMAQKVSPSIPRKKQDKQSAAPGPAIQQEHMRNATHSWDPLAFMAKTKPSEPVPEPETPPEAEAPRPKQPTALQSGAGAKRERSGPDEGKGEGPACPVKLHCPHNILAACSSGLCDARSTRSPALQRRVKHC